MKKYDHIAVAGTWDHFHVGHKKMIDVAFALGDHVQIGITTNEFVAGKEFAESIESYAVRKKSVHDYIASNKWQNRASLFQLADIYGPAIYDPALEAIVVTRKTYKNARLVQKMRLKNGLPRIAIRMVSFVKSTDGKIISSERIRKGEIDQHGFVYRSLFTKKTIYKLPEKIRAQLKFPLGPMVQNTKELCAYLLKNRVAFVSVGDVVSKALLRENRIPAIHIIDYKKQRKEIPAKNRIRSYQHIIKATNRAGSIHRAAVAAFHRALNAYLHTGKPQQILIKGEEDLLALVATACGPLGWIVVYGQPGEGVVMVKIEQRLKNYYRKLLQ